MRRLVFANILSLVASTTTGPSPDAGSEVQHANHIFNTIHSSMRQWGSSWYHNGMSLFMATVPESVQLYHGTSSVDVPSGFEWLAFEPEHAMVFVWESRPERRRKNDADGMSQAVQESDSWPEKGHRRPSMPRSGPPRPPHERPPFPSRDVPDQEPLSPPGLDDPHPQFDNKRPPPGFEGPGYFHTYRTLHPLSLLYIDGTSAGKSLKGTLDTQDFLLLNWTKEERDSGWFNELDRAGGLCNMTTSQWDGKIDGFIRMEAGFEIILCDFTKHLEQVSVTRPKMHNATIDQSWPIGYGQTGWSWVHAIAARYEGIGEGRVHLDYSDDGFVTAFDERYGLNLFDGQEPEEFPRLNYTPSGELDRLRADVDKMILNYEIQTEERPRASNWQAVTDMVVKRYADPLRYLAGLQNLTQLQSETALLLQPFVNLAHRDQETELAACVHQLVPRAQQEGDADQDPDASNASTSLARRAVTSVTRHICRTLFSILPDPNPPFPSPSLEDATESLSSLIRYLGWTEFAKCPEKCSFSEVCFIPIWPLGTVHDRAQGHGRCANAKDMGGGPGSEDGYWDMPRLKHEGTARIPGAEIPALEW